MPMQLHAPASGAPDILGAVAGATMEAIALWSYNNSVRWCCCRPGIIFIASRFFGLEAFKHFTRAPQGS